MTGPDPTRVVVAYANAAEALAGDEDLLLRYAAIAPVALVGPLSRVLSEYGRRGRRVAELEKELAETQVALTFAGAMLDRWDVISRINTERSAVRADTLSRLLRGMARRATQERRWLRAAEKEPPR